VAKQKKGKVLRAISLGAALLALVLAMVVGGLHLGAKRDREERRAQKVAVLLQDLHSDVVREFPADTANRVYDCKAERPLTPCPDYIATVTFSKDGPTKPPQIQPALKADGTVAIGLRTSNFATDRCPPDLTCNEHWSAQVTVGEGVQLFAHVSTFHGEWMGPRWLHPAAYESGVTTYFLEPEGYTVKLLAVSTDPAVVGEPLADELLGEW
jgi:hypothetical protein